MLGKNMGAMDIDEDRHRGSEQRSTDIGADQENVIQRDQRNLAREIEIAAGTEMGIGRLSELQGIGIQAGAGKKIDVDRDEVGLLQISRNGQRFTGLQQQMNLHLHAPTDTELDLALQSENPLHRPVHARRPEVHHPKLQPQALPQSHLLQLQ